MKIRLNAGDFKRAVERVAGMIAMNPFIPILECILIQYVPVRGEVGPQLHLLASDSDAVLFTHTPVESVAEEQPAQTWEVCCPSLILRETLATFGDSTLLTVQRSDSGSLLISTDAGNYIIHGDLVADFPRKALGDDFAQSGGGAVKLTVADLDALTEQITPFVASHATETDPRLTGVRVKADSEHIQFAATNRHTLVVRRQPVDAKTPVCEFSLSAKLLRLLKSIRPQNGEITRLQWGDNRVSFTTPKGCLCLGRFPEPTTPFIAYEALFNVAKPICLTVDRKAFLSVLQRVGLYGDKNGYVRLDTKGGNLFGIRVESINLMGEHEAQEQLPAILEGAEGTNLVFNHPLLYKAVAARQEQKIRLHISVPTQPVILTGGDASPSSDDYRQLVMPVYLPAT